MSEPKLHHYVPRFYLKRFTNSDGQCWVWDKKLDRKFKASPDKIAAEKHFYYQDALLAQGHDPLTMERQFSALEADAASITGTWLSELRKMEAGQTVQITQSDREAVALFIALQFLRTADTRDTLSLFAEVVEKWPALSPGDKRRLHTHMLWHDRTFSRLAQHIHKCLWIFALNSTALPFFTSDNPVAFRTGDNKQWVKAGLYDPGTYVVYPLAPDIMMYCHPKEPPFDKLNHFDNALSPVEITTEMAEGDNSAQVFMASTFIISPLDDFNDVREFGKTIGTDIYKQKD